MTVLGFIVVGAIVGALARLIIPGRNPIGIVLTILVGIVGAVLGGVVANALGVGNVLEFVFALVIAAVGVAALTALQRPKHGGAARGRRFGRSH
ncbi:GlsB/YeaQ/YmgE family stress response membrane protein [Actinomadura flavalba]|uniref:GlsB/YeaQ/YmgE family stress response membrane protein n=1 Tax=Actinomadura flavalba TaxID=1120938 RepID=UPI0004770360|nr:GlsB/YeaQ/YmgE family stress response membrane protein [Actinomadura flavalba]